MTIQDILDQAKASGQSAQFVAWLAFVLDWECEFEADGKTIRIENVAGDSGGRTFAGIDEATHPHFPFDNPHPFDVVAAYLADAWKPCHADELPFPVGAVISNFAVNLGLGVAIKLLQEAVNASPAATQAGGGKIVVDGVLGPVTLQTAQGLDALPLAETIEAEADARYRSIAANIPRDRKFLAGWLNRDAALDKWWEGLLGSMQRPQSGL